MELPEIKIDPTEFFNLQYGTVRAWVLITAVEFGLFNITVEKKTALEIVSALNTHQANTELFLNVLCSLDLLVKENGMYKNTELTDTFLVEEKESYLGGMLLFSETWNFQSRDQMKELIKTGPNPEQDNFDYTGDYYARLLRHMRNFARSGVSQHVAKEISRLPEAPKMRQMLDLGGAHGMDCIAIAQKNPTLKGIVFDHPGVVEITQEIIAEYKMEDRITVMGGDYTTDPIGDGYDLIYAKSTLNFSKDNLNPLFKKFHQALNPGGVFVSIHDGLTDESTKPSDVLVSWFTTSLSTCDFSLDREIIPDAMVDAGFKTVQTKPFSCPLGLLDTTIGRKE